MRKMHCPGLTDFMVVFFNFTDINAKEDEIRKIMHGFQKRTKIIQADHMTQLERLYEELLEASEDFKHLIIHTYIPDIKKYQKTHEVFVDKYNLIKGFIRFINRNY